MSANNAFHIAILAGDGIGPEVMAPAIEVLRKIEAKSDLRFRFTEAPAGANNYLATGKSMPESAVRLCEEADAILLGACGLPAVRYPDNTEIAPQIELRFIFDLYAGVRPARLIPGVASPIVGADQRGIDLVVIRESTEGLFASMGKGVVTHEDAREAMLVKRPWDFDVMVMENMFGDIVSDITASLIGGLGMAPSADIGDKYAVFQPCHGTAPDIMGQGKANPTGMILSAAMMLDWLADKHGVESAAEAGETIERAIDQVYAGGIKPMEFGGSNGTADITKAVLGAL